MILVARAHLITCAHADMALHASPLPMLSSTHTRPCHDNPPQWQLVDLSEYHIVSLLATSVNRAISLHPTHMMIWLPPTGSSKEAMLPRMAEYAAAGYVAVAIDCRYHGARAAADAAGSARDGYQQALVRCASCRVEHSTVARHAP